MAVTVPDVSNCGEADCPLCRVPLELTLDVTSPRATATVGRVDVAAGAALWKKTK
jgi:hypothetical protein